MIPTEIYNALKGRNFTLLIKGAPGSGKTTLALTIAKDFVDRVIYISSRVNPEELSRQVPWINSLIENKVIYDATITRLPKKENNLRIRYSNVSEFIRRIYDIADGLQKDGVLLIIDSIDAIKEFFNLPCDSYQLETALIDIIDTYNFNIVFVSEIQETTKLDFLADGVIKLKPEIKDGAIIRKLIISKLRGQEIKNTEYYFTILKDGFFAIPFVTSHFTSFKNAPKYEIFKNTHFSLGVKELDDIFDKKIIPGTTILLEVDPETPSEYYIFLSDLIGINMIRAKYPWYMMSMIYFDIDIFYSMLKESLKQDIKDLFIGYLPATYYSDSRETNIKREFKLFPFSEKPEQTALQFKSLLSKMKSKTFYLTVFVDLLAATYSVSDTLSLVEYLSKIVSEHKGLGIFMVFSSFDKIKHLRGFFNYHIKIEKVGNIVTLRVLKPITTHYFALIQKGEKDFPISQYIPIK